MEPLDFLEMSSKSAERTELSLKASKALRLQKIGINDTVKRSDAWNDK